MKNIVIRYCAVLCFVCLAGCLLAQNDDKFPIDSTLAARHLYRLQIRASEECTLKVNGIDKGHLKEGLELSAIVPADSCTIDARAISGALYHRTFYIGRGLAGGLSFYDIIFQK